MYRDCCYLFTVGSFDVRTQGFSLFDVVSAVIVGKRAGHQRFNQVAVCTGL
jgi:hypothetical protein